MISPLAFGAALLLAASIGPACANRDLFVVDLVNNPASLDPQVQWDPDSYFIYRNVFDNLVTRDGSGKIVPQVATAWTYQSDTQIVFTLRDDIRFEDGSVLTPDDVVFTIKRITDPAFKSPQLSQFDSIASAEAVDSSRRPSVPTRFCSPSSPNCRSYRAPSSRSLAMTGSISIPSVVARTV